MQNLPVFDRNFLARRADGIGFQKAPLENRGALNARYQPCSPDCKNRALTPLTRAHAARYIPSRAKLRSHVQDSLRRRFSAAPTLFGPRKIPTLSVIAMFYHYNGQKLRCQPMEKSFYAAREKRSECAAKNRVLGAKCARLGSMDAQASILSRNIRRAREKKSGKD